MTREEAYKLVKKNLKQENLVKHCLAVEAVMRELVRCFKKDAEKWGLAHIIMFTACPGRN